VKNLLKDINISINIIYDFCYKKFLPLLKPGSKKICIVLIINLLIIDVCQLYGQTDVYQYTNYTTRDGLSQNTIYSIAQDTLGFMWFGTQEGLNRFDGKNFKIFEENPTDSTSLVGNWVNTMIIDNKNFFYIGTSKALNRFNFLNETFSSCMIEGSRILCLTKDNLGRLWVGTNKGLTYLNTKGTSDNLPAKLEIKYFKDCEVKSVNSFGDSLLVATNKGLFSIFLENLKEINSNIFKELVKNEDINTLFRDSNSKIYFGTQSGKRFSYDKVKNCFISDRNYDAPITCMIEDGLGAILAGTKNDRIVVDSKYSRNLSDQNVISMYIDRERNLWIGTLTGGINKSSNTKLQFNNHNFIVPNINSKNDKIIRSFYETLEGNFYIGTEYGSLYLHDKGKKEYKLTTTIAGGIFSLVEDPLGILWIGSGNGKLFYSNKNGFASIDLKCGKIRIIKKDNSNRYFWIGTEEKGLIKFDFRIKKIVPIKNEAIHNLNVYSIQPDKISDSLIWIGTLDYGLKSYNSISNTLTDVSSLNSKNTNLNKLSILVILQDIKDNNILWLGTSNGLIKFKKDLYLLESISSQNMTDNSILGILQYKENLWLRTTKGRIIKFNIPSEFENHFFDWRDGIQDGEGVGNAYYLSSTTGKIYFGGTRGYEEFYPDSISTKEVPPKLYFNQMSVISSKNKTNQPSDISIAQKIITYDSIITLTYKRIQRITIDFVGLNFSAPDRIHYWGEVKNRHKIIKYDFGTENSIQFYRLMWGKYNITIWCSDNFASSEEKPPNAKSILLIIKPPFYATISFYITIAIASILFSLFIVNTLKKGIKRRIKDKLEKWAINQRIKQLEKRNAFLERINRLDNTIEIAEMVMQGSLELFGFDYVVITMVDYFTNRISSQFLKTRDPYLVNPNDWKKEADYDLSDKDILCEVVKEKVDKIILGHSGTLSDHPELNEKIFKKHGHEHLNRIFVPILHRVYKSAQLSFDTYENLVIAVVEAGFHKTSRNDFPAELRSDYVFFINSCEQNFFRAYIFAERELISSKIDKFIEDEDYNKFLCNVLQEIISLMRLDYGKITFLSFDDDTEMFELDSSSKDEHNEKRKTVIRKDDLKTEGIVWRSISTCKTYYSNDVKFDPYSFKIEDNTNSELASPLIYCGKVIGAINLKSFHKNFFNNIKARIIQEILDRVVPIYLKKKLDIKLRSLIVPFDKLSDLNIIYKALNNTIEDYFLSDFVSLWILDNDIKHFNQDSDKTHDYVLIYASKKLELIYQTKNFTRVKAEIFKGENELIPSAKGCCSSNGSLNNFEEFHRRIGMCSIILVPIAIGIKRFGFISIVSKSNIDQLFPEDQVFLTQISMKAGLALQYAQLFNSFKIISNTLTHGTQRSTLKQIAKSAHQVLNADLVILYKYDALANLFSKDITYYGNFLEHDTASIIKNHGLEDTFLVSKVLETGSVFIENEDEYIDYVSDRGEFKSSIFKESFWYREKNKSVAALRLEFDDEPIGVMFINYRTIHKFDNEFKSIIQTFASLASSAIANAKNLEIIKDQKKRLEERTEKLKFEYDEIYNKMEEMVPSATRTSFYLILEGMNHDIRNFLLRLAHATIQIDKNSNRLSKTDKKLIKDCLVIIEKGIARITNLLELFDFKTFKQEYLDTYMIIRQVIAFFKDNYDEKVEFDINDLNKDIDLLYAVKAEFSMIFYNLFTNSVSALKKKIKEKKAKIKVSSKLEKNNFIFVVEDNGTGIKSDIINYIFEPGFTTKQLEIETETGIEIKKGLGIGLFFVKQVLINSFNGDITCESSYNDYTKFIIRIPKI
jgi:ligand-binding sensor domain-containing protein/signal transduction histidine kinase